MSANKKIQFQIHEVNETGYEYNEQLAPIADEQFQIRIGLRFEANNNNFTLAFNNTALRKTIVNVANTNATSPEINGKLETNVKYLLVGSKYLYLRTKPNTLNPTNKPPQT